MISRVDLKATAIMKIRNYDCQQFKLGESLSSQENLNEGHM